MTPTLKKLILGITFLVIAVSCSGPRQESVYDEIRIDLNDPKVWSIYDAQDQRAVEKLEIFARSAEPSFRFLAAQAMASVQHESNLRDLKDLVTDPYVEIRNEAAFALGQSYHVNAIPIIQDALNSESEDKIIAKLYEGLGKCGDEAQLSFLISLDHSQNPVLGFGQAAGIYRLALRNIISQAAIVKMKDFLNEAYSDDTRRMAANYLARLTQVDLMTLVDDITDHLSNDPDPVVRSNMAIALNKTNSGRARKALLDAANDEDYRVRVNVLRTLVYYPYDEVSDVVFKGLEDPHVQVKVAASEFFLLITMRKDAAKYALYASKMKDWLPQANLLKAALKFAEPALEDKINSYLKNKARTETNPYAKAAFVEALSGDVKNYELLANIAFSADHAAVTTAAMQGLNRMRIAEEFTEQIRKADLDQQRIENDFLTIYKNGIASGETTLTAVSAIALRNPDLGFREQIDDLSFLRTAQENLILPREIETYIELQKTIDFFEGKEISKQPPTPYNNPIDWDHVSSIIEVEKVRIKTTKGDMVAELYLEKAPGTVSNFLKLAQDNFYDSLSFHRVVPNFVAQGGCPRGDGYGSTETSIRSEFGNHHFQEGSLGIASSGKDTESCQWYVCHFPTFHLDGGYTNFATVTEGLEVAHQLEIGDLILDVEIL